jgi:hypothetical protein
MRATLLTILMVMGILAGFFLSACAVVMVGLAAWKAKQDGLSAGVEMILNAWPLFVGGVLFLGAGYYSYRVRCRSLAASPDAAVLPETGRNPPS